MFFVMERGSGSKEKKAFAHIKSREHQARRVEDIAGRCPKKALFNGWEWRIWFQKFYKNKIQVSAGKNHPFSTHWVAMVAV